MISGIPISSFLLEQLKKKLNVGNLRSIQLNCIPGRTKSKLDLADAKVIDESVPENFLDKLFNHKTQFTYSISFDNLNLNISSEDEEKQKKLGLLSKRLNHLNNYNKEDYQEYGYKSFGFGFPVVVFRPQESPEKLIRAPLFIWHLSIEKDLSKTNTWKISRSIDQEIEFNNLLRSYLGELCGINLEGFNEDELKDGVLDFDEIIQNTVKFIRQFHSAPEDELNPELRNSFKKGIEAIPSNKTLDNQANAIPKVYWGGVFGRFHLRNEAIRKEMREDMFELLEGAEENEEDSNEAVDPLLHSETAAKSDPSQLGILNYLKKNKHVIIQGPPGTGKSESITGIIINALEHGKTCLVVCEKKTAMEVLRNNLNDIDPKIGKLAAVVEDVATDRRSLVDSVRDRYDQLGNTVLQKPSSSNLSEMVELIEDKIRDIHRRKEFLKTKEIIKNGDVKGWTSTVGNELKARFDNGDSSLKRQLHKKNIEVDKIDYQSDINFLKEFEQQSEKLSFKNTLNFVSDAKFNSLSTIELEDELDKLLVSDTDKMEDFIQEFEKFLKKTKEKVDHEVTESIERIKHLHKKLDDIYVKLADQSLIKKNDWWFKVVKSFRGLSDKLLKNVEFFLSIPQLVQDLDIEFKKLRCGVNLDKELSIDSLKRNLKVVGDKHQDLKKNLDELKKKLFNELINKPFKEISFGGDIRQDFNYWTTQTNKFLEKYSDRNTKSGFDGFKRALDDLKWVLACSKSYKEAEERSFFEHYEWQKRFRSQSQPIQEIITIFLDNEVNNWEAQFNEYYINKKLQENFDYQLTGSFETQLQRLKEEKNQLVKEIKKRIPHYWTAVQSQESQKINLPKLYNKRGSKGNRRNSLRKIARKSFKSLTAYFPVMMVSPSVCASMFELEPDLFDYVIFDEASQLKVEESLSTLIRGERKIVSGDKNQMPPSYWFTKVGGADDEIEDEEDFDPYQSWDEELQTASGALDLADSESLLQFAELCKFESYHLDFHYRSHHPLLIEFSNAAFYNSRLNPLPERINQSPIQFIPVNGINENQQNKDEANIAVDILKNINRNHKGNLPSVGIATFNRKQKNLVWDVLKREIQLDEEFNQKFQEFEENGLFVKNLENIQGDERDIIILSTTFGKDENGSFSRFYGPINTSMLGRRLLNVIVTRAKKKIFVLTSIPNDVYMNYRQELGSDHEQERGYLHAYLAYAKAVSKGDMETVKSIQNFLRDRKQISSKTYGLTESPFEEAVYQALKDKINPDRITLQHKTGGFRIDLAIKSKITGREFIAIECDGATYHSSAEDYAWDNYRQDILEEHGFVFHRIWSRNWWENSARELKNLVDFIHRQDEQDQGYELFNDPAAEDIDLESSPQEMGVFVEPKENISEIQETVALNDAKAKETQNNGEQVEIDYQAIPKPKVEIGKVITIKYLDNNKELNVKLAKGRNEVKQSNGVTILDEKSPIGEAILGKRVDETVEIGNLEKYCKILSIN